MHAYYNPPIQTPAKWTRANALDKASPSSTKADPVARSTEWWIGSAARKVSTCPAPPTIGMISGFALGTPSPALSADN